MSKTVEVWCIWFGQALVSVSEEFKYCLKFMAPSAQTMAAVLVNRQTGISRIARRKVSNILGWRVQIDMHYVEWTVISITL